MTTPPEGLVTMTCKHCKATWVPRKPDVATCPRCRKPLARVRVTR